MAKPRAFTVAQGSGNNINVYDATSSSLVRTVTLGGGDKIVSAPVVFGDGFSVVVETSGGRYMKTFNFPLCNLKSITQVT